MLQIALGTYYIIPCLILTGPWEVGINLANFNYYEVTSEALE